MTVAIQLKYRIPRGGDGMDLRKSKMSSTTVDFLAPMRLFQQIVLMQVGYYLIGIVLIATTLLLSGYEFTLRIVFSWEPVTFGTTLGWLLAALWLLDMFFSVLAMTIIVGRSKLALDFTLTLHGINLVVAWLVAGKFPLSLLWWLVQITSVVLMVSLGTWTSRWWELRSTFFDTSSRYELLPVANTGPPLDSNNGQVPTINTDVTKNKLAVDSDKDDMRTSGEIVSPITTRETPPSQPKATEAFQVNTSKA